MNTASNTRLFEECLSAYRTHLDSADEHLNALGIEHGLVDIRAAADREEFRIGVFGRFKTGKSSVVNALLAAAISPADVLPCTSQLIEFRHAERLSCWRMVDGKPKKASREEFSKGTAGAASAPRKEREDWLVTLPMLWLGHNIVLVDTPGTDEDEGRQDLADQELRRTDAAVVVLRANQAGGLTELDQVEELSNRVGSVIVVVNRCDQITGDLNEILVYARERVAPLGVPPERVLPFSAVQALEGNQEGVKQLKALRDAISDVLVGGVAGARLASLIHRAEHALKSLEPAIGTKVLEAENCAATAEVALEKAGEALGSSSGTLRAITRIFSSASESLSQECGDMMKKAWPSLVGELVSREKRWKGRSNVLTSPKVFAEEIANKAKKDLEKSVYKFIENEINPAVKRTTATALTHVQERAKGLIDAAKATKLGSEEKIKKEILAQAVEQAFGKSVDHAYGDVAIIAAVSSIVGSNISAVVASSILAIILLLLNPVTLVAAVVTGFFVAVFGGRSWVEDRVRSKIAEKLDTELRKANVKRKLGEGVAVSCGESVDKLGQAYVSQLERLVKQTEKEYTCASESADRLRQAAVVAQNGAEEARHALAVMGEVMSERLKVSRISIATS